MEQENGSKDNGGGDTEKTVPDSRGWDKLEVGHGLGCQSCRELTSFERTKAPRLVRTGTLASVGVEDLGA